MLQVSEGENVSGQLRRISPTVEEIEAEFWRIVETPEEVLHLCIAQLIHSENHLLVGKRELSSLQHLYQE